MKLTSITLFSVLCFANGLFGMTRAPKLDIKPQRQQLEEVRELLKKQRQTIFAEMKTGKNLSTLPECESELDDKLFGKKLLPRAITFYHSLNCITTDTPYKTTYHSLNCIKTGTPYKATPLIVLESD